MPSVIETPNGKYRGFARHKGQSANKLFEKRTAALAWAANVEEEMRAGTWRAEPRPESRRAISIREAFNEYKTSATWLSKAETTRRSELTKWPAILSVIGGKTVQQITSEDIASFVARRLQTTKKRTPESKPQQLSTDYVRLEVAALSGLFNWCLKEKRVITANPCRGVERPKSTRRMARIEDDMLGQILVHDAISMDSVAYTFFRLLFSCVCRPGELATARRSWLRFNPPQILIPRAKNDDSRSIIIPEPMLDDVLKVINMQDDSPFIFSTRGRDGEWKPYNYASVWRKVRKDLPVGELGIVPHVARHEGVSKLFERTTLSDGAIAAISGHRSPQALWRYKHLRAEHSRGYVQALNKRVHQSYDLACSPSAPYEPMLPGELLKPVDYGGKFLPKEDIYTDEEAYREMVAAGAIPAPTPVAPSEARQEQPERPKLTRVK